MFRKQFKRHQEQTNLRFIHDTHYRNFDLSGNGTTSLILNYLERAYLTQWRAINDYDRVLALRFDLRFPYWMPESELGNDNQKISLFLRHLNQEIKSANTKYSTILRYVWCREQGSSDKPHYHFMIYLNYDAFSRMGSIKPSREGGYERQNMYHRISRAWAKALNYMSCDILGLVEPGRSEFGGDFFEACLHRDDWMSQNDAFFRVSYLCKAHTKPYGKGIHFFGTSRV